MKKTVALVLATIFCLLTLCACGNKQDKVADELVGTWERSFTVMGDTVIEKITFSNVDGNAGSYKYEMISSTAGSVVTRRGVFDVRDEDTIHVTFTAKFDNDGNMETYDAKEADSNIEYSYTYENGVLEVFNGEFEYTKK